MPRPQTLQSTGRQPPSDAYQVLTPRTPRGHHDGDELGADEDGSYATYAQQQSEPLLASSTSDHFPQHVTTAPARSRRTVKGAVGAGLSRIPMIGGILAAIGILAMLGVSVKRPDVLEKALLGNNTVNSMGTSHLHPVNSSEFLSYENYTEFPLAPEQYLMVRLHSHSHSLLAHSSIPGMREEHGRAHAPTPLLGHGPSACRSS
jgi:hypothetical protein